ncbi:BIIDXI-like protein At5g11420 [Wolffia australiana]
MKSVVIVAAVLLGFVATVSLAVSDGLLDNGNFERGPNKSDLRGTEVIGRRAVPGWEISGFVEYIEAGHMQGDMLLVVPQGAFAVRLGNEASIKQTIKVTPGEFYSITFSAGRTCGQQERLNISVDGDSGVLPIQTTYSSNGWDSYAWAFKAVAAESSLRIHNPGVEDDPACGPLLDAVAIKALHPPRASNQNLLKNGDFEEGPYVFPDTPWGVLIPPITEDDHSPLPGWIVESLKAVKYVDAAHFSAPQGRRAVELLAGREGALVQITRTVPGRNYRLSFAVGDANNTCRGSMVVEAFADRSTAKVPYQSTGKGGFKRAVLEFTATGSRSRIMFFSTFYHTRNDDLSSLCGPVVDDVRVLSIHRSRRLL